MIIFPRIFLLLITCALSSYAINPQRVVVVYNQNDPESKLIGERYIELRKIPNSHLIGIQTSTTIDISREEYKRTIKDPLNKIFTARGWWGAIKKDNTGISFPSYSKIDLLVCIRGIPLMIKPKPVDPDKPKPTVDPKAPFAHREEAAVDSELTLLGVEGYPLVGILNNAYFKKDTHIRDADFSGAILTGRIDGPSSAICLRMMRDAILTEKSGLWGMAYIDQGGRAPAGDQWLENIHKRHLELGIPTVLDKNKDTFLPYYPMQHAALYFGWYAHHRNGPFLNPKMALKPGSIAVHIHSYSGQGTRRTDRHWSGSILAHGAAVTCANMYEPYLQLTHHLDTFHDRLLKGYTVAEAGAMANPTLSWQATIIGDPLYRPFKIKSAAEGNVLPEDKTFRAIRLGKRLMRQKPDELSEKFTAIAKKKGDGIYYEYLALQKMSDEQYGKARELFKNARETFTDSRDKLRNTLSIVDSYRREKNKEAALRLLKETLPEYANSQEALAIKSLILILDPPPPPPAKPGDPAPPTKKKK